MTPSGLRLLLALVLVVGVGGVIVYARASSSRQLAIRRARLTVATRSVGPLRFAVDRLVRSTPVGRSVQERLVRAGHHDVLVGDVVALGAVAAGAIVLLLLGLVTLPAAVLVAIAWILIANAYLDHLVQRRIDAFADQLPDIAQVMSNAAAAGIAIPNALALTAKEMSEPAASLLGVAVKELAVGASLAEAMDSLKRRVPSREMAILVSTLIIQQRAGGDVIDALREMSINLEQRRDLRREVRTVMSGVKFTAYAIMGLGVATLAMLETISPGTLRNMTEQVTGQLILLLAFTFYLLGFLAVRRLARVDL